MKSLVVAVLAAGASLTSLSSAQAITVTPAPLAETARNISPLLEVQMNSVGGCTRGYVMSPTGCREQTFGFKKSKKKKRAKK
jgi:hypothetical protein